MPNPWAGRAAKSEELDPKKSSETESENTQEDLAEIKADVSLDALHADVIKAESKEEIEEDLTMLQNDLETTNPVSIFQELNALGKPVDKLKDDELIKLAEVDYTIGRYMVGNLMSTLMLKHKDATGRIDEVLFRESLSKLNILSWRGLQTELLNNKVTLSPAEQELFAAFDKGGKFVDSYFVTHYQQEVVTPWVQAMPQCVVAYNQYYAKAPAGVAPEVKGLIDDIKTKGFKETIATNKPFRTAVIAGGVLAGVVGAYSLIRSWTGKKRKRKGIIGGLLTAALTGTAAAAIGGGLTYRWMKEKEGKKLTFEESLLALQSDVQNKLSEDSLKAHIGVVKYDELTKELMSYGTGTVIDKDAKKIPGLDVQFSDYKQMLHVANLMNHIKFTYKGRCRNTTPFFTGAATGDIYIKTVKNENKDQEDEVISGGWRGTLRSFCPDLDNIRGGAGGKEKLVQYLNSQPGWQQHNAVAQADTGEDKVEDLANDIQKEIEKAIPEVKLGGARGSLKVEKLNDKTNYYQVESWDSKAFFTAKETGKKKNIIYAIDNLDINFDSAEECIRVSNLINRTKKEFAGKCTKSEPFFRDKIGPNRSSIGIYTRGTDRLPMAATYLDKSSAKNELPTLLRSSQRKLFIKYLNSQKNENGSSLWKNT